MAKKEAYSNRRASIGSKRLALRAGYQPKNTPVAKHTAKLTMTLVTETLMGMLNTFFTISEAAMPIPAG